MLTTNEITEIFYLCDDFSKEFDKSYKSQSQKISIAPTRRLFLDIIRDALWFNQFSAHRSTFSSQRMLTNKPKVCKKTIFYHLL